MTTGAEQYRNAIRLMMLSTDHECGTPEERSLYAAAQINATLALAAATALRTTSEKIGDSDEITDWARLIQPKAVGDGRMKWASTGDHPDSSWTSDEGGPRRGDVWVDEDGAHWLVQLDMSATAETVDGYPLQLACLDTRGGYSSWESVCKMHGPLKLASRPWLNADLECPF